MLESDSEEESDDDGDSEDGGEAPIDDASDSDDDEDDNWSSLYVQWGTAWPLLSYQNKLLINFKSISLHHNNF